MLAPPRCASLPKGRAVGFGIQALKYTTLRISPPPKSTLHTRPADEWLGLFVCEKHSSMTKASLRRSGVCGGLDQRSTLRVGTKRTRRWVMSPRSPKAALFEDLRAAFDVAVSRCRKCRGGGSLRFRSIQGCGTGSKEEETSAAPSTTLFGDLRVGLDYAGKAKDHRRGGLFLGRFVVGRETILRGGSRCSIVFLPS